MEFYKFWEILNERNFPERPDTPPETPDWSDEDLEWGEWEEDGTTVRMNNGHFVDGQNRPVPFLDQYAAQVQGWDQTYGISLQFNKMVGTLPGEDNETTGEFKDDEEVRVELENLALADVKNPQNKIELPDNLIPKVKAQFFRGYE